MPLGAAARAGEFHGRLRFAVAARDARSKLRHRPLEDRDTPTATGPAAAVRLRLRAGGRPPRARRARHRRGRRRLVGLDRRARPHLAGRRPRLVARLRAVRAHREERELHPQRRAELPLSAARPRSRASRTRCRRRPAGTSSSTPGARRRHRARPTRASTVLAVAAAFRSETARRLPVKPIEALRRDYPGLDPGSFGSEEDIAPRDMTAFGVLLRGVHYAGGCETRAGHYPYCDEMLLPSYSLAKSVMAGFALMRAELLHPGARKRARHRLRAGVPRGGRLGRRHLRATARHGDRALRLAGRPGRRGRDRTRAASSSRTTHAEKIRIACTRYPRKEPPGGRLVYHTTRHLHARRRARRAGGGQKKGPDADFYRDLAGRADVPAARAEPRNRDMPRRTLDDVAQPFTGWGLVLRRDDIVKLGGFLSLGEGKLGEEQLLDPQMVRARAAARPEADTGLPARRTAVPVQQRRVGLEHRGVSRLHGARVDPVHVGLRRNHGRDAAEQGVVYYYVSDGGEFRWARAVAETSRLRAGLPRGEPDVTADARPRRVASRPRRRTGCWPRRCSLSSRPRASSTSTSWRRSSPGLVDGLGFSEGDAGRVGSLNIYGAALGALVAVAIVGRVRWRAFAACALVALMAIDAVSILRDEARALMAHALPARHGRRRCWSASRTRCSRARARRTACSACCSRAVRARRPRHHGAAAAGAGVRPRRAVRDAGRLQLRHAADAAVPRPLSRRPRRTARGERRHPQGTARRDGRVAVPVPGGQHGAARRT